MVVMVVPAEQTATLETRVVSAILVAPVAAVLVVLALLPDVPETPDRGLVINHLLAVVAAPVRISTRTILAKVEVAPARGAVALVKVVVAVVFPETVAAAVGGLWRLIRTPALVVEAEAAAAAAVVVVLVALVALIRGLRTQQLLMEYR